MRVEKEGEEESVGVHKYHKSGIYSHVILQRKQFQEVNILLRKARV